MKTPCTFRFFACLALLVALLQPWQAALAQCAMCAATVESNAKEEAKTIAEGLNTGILYLMTIPYVLFGTIAYLWYRNAKKQARARREAALRKAQLRAQMQGA